MWLIVGLGNPGKDYEYHRHNIGFMAVDAIADHFGFPDYKAKYQGAYAEGKIGGEKCAILKPLTFMNESGKSVGEAARFYKIPPANIVVFHDELDLPPGRLRVKTGGGAGGHNGLRSMDQWLGTDAYKRVRLGIGHPGSKDRVTGYVLGNFAKTDEEWLGKLIDVLPGQTELLLQNKDEDFMTRVARLTQPPKEKKEKPKEDTENGI